MKRFKMLKMLIVVCLLVSLMTGTVFAEQPARQMSLLRVNAGTNPESSHIENVSETAFTGEDHFHVEYSEQKDPDGDGGHGGGHGGEGEGSGGKPDGGKPSGNSSSASSASEDSSSSGSNSSGGGSGSSSGSDGGASSGGDGSNTGGDSSNTGGDSSNTGGDSSNTGGDSSNTGGDSSNTGGDSSNTDGDGKPDDNGSDSSSTGNNGENSDDEGDSSIDNEGNAPGTDAEQPSSEEISNKPTAMFSPSADTPTPNPGSNNDNNNGNNTNGNNGNSGNSGGDGNHDAAPVSTPVPEITAAVENEETIIHTLSFGISDVQKYSNALSLDLELLREKMGTYVRVYEKKGQEEYKQIGSVGERIDLKADGEAAYVYVEDKQHMLWAGVYSGKAYEIPQTGKNAFMAYDIPRELFYCKQTVEVAQEGTAGNELILDVSEIAKALACAPNELKIEASYKNTCIYSEFDVQEDGVVHIEINGQSRFVRISYQGNYLWAGKFEQPASGKNRVAHFHAFPDLGFKVGSLDEKGIAVSFNEEAAPGSFFEKIEFEYLFLNNKGKEIDRVLTAAADKDGQKRIEDNALTVSFNNKKIAAAGQLRIGLHFDDAEIYAHLVRPVKAVAEMKEELLLLELDKETVQYYDGKFSFSGTVYAEEGGKTPDEWEFYISGKVYKDVEWEKTEAGYRFTVQDYPATSKYGLIKIRIQGAKANSIMSKAKMLFYVLPVMEVEIEGYVGQYDGKAHSIRYEVLSSVSEEEMENIAVSHALCDKKKEKKDLEWSGGLPSYSDAGSRELYIKVMRDGFETVYYNPDGEVLDAPDGYANTIMKIKPSPVAVRVSAKQGDEEVFYNGKEQSVPFTYVAEIVDGAKDDEEWLFDLSKITKSNSWVGDSISVVDAGEYAVQPEEGQFAFIKKLDPNFNIEVEWDENSKVVVGKVKVAFDSGSACGVYSAMAEAVTNHDVDIVGEYVDREYYSGDVLATGIRSEAGVSINTIEIQEEGEFKKHQKNYEFDLEEKAGILVVFPQSISNSDTNWNAVDSHAIDLQAYAGSQAVDLPGYYLGMHIELKEESGFYTGEAHSIVPLFKDKDGHTLELTEGVDYILGYMRAGEKTEDITSAGQIQVIVQGMGNYTGTVELSYDIERRKISDAGIQLDSWTYDGCAAGSAEHMPIVSVNADQYIYCNEMGDEITPPSDAGVYTVQAVWNDSDNYLRTESNICQFRINPAEVSVVIHEVGGDMAVYDESGLFDPDTMIEIVGPEFKCNNRNFSVDFDVSDQVRISNAQKQAVVYLESWVYDGEAAGSDAHKMIVAGVGNDVVYTYFDSDGNEVEAPVEIGSYRLEASWGTPRVEVETSFEIMPRPVIVRVMDAIKTYGDADPEFSRVVEGTLEGEDILYEIVREPGEDTGAYGITVSGDILQGHYELIIDNATLIIEPAAIDAFDLKSFDDGTVELMKEGMLVRDATGNILQQDKDYVVEIQTDVSNAGASKVFVEGIGNYTGHIEQECDMIAKTTDLFLLNAEGEDLAENELSAANNGEITVAGRIEANAFLDTDAVEVKINGVSAEVQIEVIDEFKCAFRVVDSAVFQEKPDVLDIAVYVDDIECVSESYKINYPFESMLWLIMAIVMAIGAGVSTIICIQTGKRVRRAKLRLLDAVSRQSNRTIRERSNS